MAHVYSNLYNLPTTGLRFFTVYGPFGRPDMSLFKFVDLTLKNKMVDLLTMEIIQETSHILMILPRLLPGL